MFKLVQNNLYLLLILATCTAAHLWVSTEENASLVVNNKQFTDAVGEFENLEDTTTFPAEYLTEKIPQEMTDDISEFEQNHNDSRINGGQLVDEIVPYQVSLQLRRRNKWNHFCSGSIISPHHVLTAAHCVDKAKVKDVAVVCGTLRWKKGGDRHKVVAKRVHPKFSMKTLIINDIAVLKVTPPFNLHKRTINAISLSGPSRVGDKVLVRLTGWGSTTPTSESGLPEQLRMLEYRTISNEECAKKGFRITRNELCALAPMGKGACVGDSGGPLVTPQGIPQLVGIVSYGTAQCAQGQPDVYTRVSSFLPYINKVITTDMP